MGKKLHFPTLKIAISKRNKQISIDFILSIAQTKAQSHTEAVILNEMAYTLKFFEKTEYSFIFYQNSHRSIEKMGVADYTEADFKNFWSFVIRTKFCIVKIGTHKNLRMFIFIAHPYK